MKIRLASTQTTTYLPPHIGQVGQLFFTYRDVRYCAESAGKPYEVPSKELLKEACMLVELEGVR